MLHIHLLLSYKKLWTGLTIITITLFIVTSVYLLEFQKTENNEITETVLVELLKEGKVHEFNEARKNWQHGLSFANLDLSRLDLGGINLENATLINSDFKFSQFTSADVPEIDWTLEHNQRILYDYQKLIAKIEHAPNLFDKKVTNLSHTYMPNTNMFNTRFLVADLSYANLENSNMQGRFLATNMSHANLERTVFQEAAVIDSDLSYTNMQKAWLWDANFMYTDLTGANLSNSYLVNANFTNANLSNANLTNADLAGSILSNTDLTNTDLRYVKNLPISVKEAVDRGAIVN